MMSTNPFMSSPVPPQRFVGRKHEINKIQGRLLNQDSTSVIGERRTGKTSLLYFLEDPMIRQKAGFSDMHIFTFVNLQFLKGQCTPTDFWCEVLKAVKKSAQIPGFQQNIDRICALPAIEARNLKEILPKKNTDDFRFVLLLDEFEIIAQNDRFGLDFYNGFRALLTSHNLALVTASRRSLFDLIVSDETRSSSFFNIFDNVFLLPFLDDDVKAFFSKYLAESEVEFNDLETEFLLDWVGPHPYFLQMGSHLLYSLILQRQYEKLRFEEVDFKRQFRDSTAAQYMKKLWEISEPKQRVVLTLLSLLFLSQQDSQGTTFQELAQYHKDAGSVLQMLEKRGLILARKDKSAKKRLLLPARKSKAVKYRLVSRFVAEWIYAEIRRLSKGDQLSKIQRLLNKGSKQRQLWELLESIAGDKSASIPPTLGPESEPKDKVFDAAGSREAFKTTRGWQRVPTWDKIGVLAGVVAALATVIAAYDPIHNFFQGLVDLTYKIIQYILSLI